MTSDSLNVCDCQNFLLEGVSSDSCFSHKIPIQIGTVTYTPHVSNVIACDYPINNKWLTVTNVDTSYTYSWYTKHGVFLTQNDSILIDSVYQDTSYYVIANKNNSLCRSRPIRVSVIKADNNIYPDTIFVCPNSTAIMYFNFPTGVMPDSCIWAIDDSTAGIDSSNCEYLEFSPGSQPQDFTVDYNLNGCNQSESIHYAMLTNTVMRNLTLDLRCESRIVDNDFKTSLFIANLPLQDAITYDWTIYSDSCITEIYSSDSSNVINLPQVICNLNEYYVQLTIQTCDTTRVFACQAVNCNNFYKNGNQAEDVVEYDSRGSKTPNSFNLYPNPTSSQVTIEYYYPKNSILQAEIYDLNGRFITLYPLNPADNNVEVALPNLTNGVYVVKIIGDNNLLNVKKLEILKN